MVGVINDVGTDISSSWDFNSDSDLVLVSEVDNITQSIVNRLNTHFGSLDSFYTEYGSYIHGFMGWVHNDMVLEFMKIEIENVFKQDPRLQFYDLNLEYNSVGEILCNLTIYFDNDSDISLSLVITEENNVNILNEGVYDSN